MKRIRYTKYTGDPASEMSMEDMLKALSEYLLDSGFQDPWSRFAELDGEHTMENLREALRQALEAGDLFDQDMQQRIDEMAENGQLDELIEQLETELGSAEIFTALFELELAGRVRQLPGKNYVRAF